MQENNGENKDSNESAPKTHDYWAKLTEYEGPLDILLHFVREDELNIYDIPISKITKDFLGYVNYIQSLDIELAGEFLLMAAELMKIKARMLIPQINLEGDEIEEDPRLLLVRKLLEYKRFKDASAEVAKYEEEARKIFLRKFFDNDPREYQHDYAIDPTLKNLTIFNLIKGYKTVLTGMRQEIIHPIELLNMTPELQREFVISYFMDNVMVEFDKLILPMEERMKIVCTFIAILQLALEGYLKIIVDSENISKFAVTRTDAVLDTSGHPGVVNIIPAS